MNILFDTRMPVASTLFWVTAITLLAILYWWWRHRSARAGFEAMGPGLMGLLWRIGGGGAGVILGGVALWRHESPEPLVLAALALSAWLLVYPLYRMLRKGFGPRVAWLFVAGVTILALGILLV